MVLLTLVSYKPPLVTYYMWMLLPLESNLHTIYVFCYICKVIYILYIFVFCYVCNVIYWFPFEIIWTLSAKNYIVGICEILNVCIPALPLPSNMPIYTLDSICTAQPQQLEVFIVITTTTKSRAEYCTCSPLSIRWCWTNRTNPHLWHRFKLLST